MTKVDMAVRAVGLGASAFFGFKAIELLVEFPEPCQLMLEQARAHPAVEERLGLPLHRSWLWSGRVTEKRASVQIPVWGERGSATLVGRAVCTPVSESSTRWDVLMLELESPGMDPPPVSLMPEVPQASPEEMAKHAAFHAAMRRGPEPA
jgi:hypothetical protein